ncbi:MAG: 1-(5-phosphoribosyl)-5-[(5-phosphoribosylamino)methylideneamino]imidazole-4-carboxamide isomerase [Elusimicrobiota bacterium]
MENTSFRVIPAIDIRNSQCVRLTKGKIETEHVYSNDPVFIAKLWQTQGAERLHVVDLDGAFCGNIKNVEIIEAIRKAVNMVIEVGGGIRSIKSIEKVLKLGVDKVILGTTVVYNPKLVEQAAEKFGDKIIIAMDITQGKLSIGGWKEVTAMTPEEVLPKLEKLGIKEVIYTDTTKDGTLEGPNVEGVRNFCDITSMHVISSGGVATLEHVSKLLEVKKLKGVVIGKALYEGTIKLNEAIELAKRV